MKWLWQYLENEPENPILIVLGILLYSAVCLLNLCLWSFLYFEDIFIGLRLVYIDIFIMLFFLALIEEIQFRAIWLFMVALSYKRGYISKRLAGVLIFIFIVVISFFYFGLGHYPGKWSNLVIQGVVGVIFAITYLKFGGIKGKFLKPLMITTSVHALYNFCILCIMVIRNPHF